MPRTVSLSAMRAAMAQTSEKVWATLLEVSHPNLAETQRFCDNTESLVHNGYSYLAFPFRAVLPSDETEREPKVDLIISNVDQRIIDDLRSISSGPTVVMKVVLADTPNTVEYGPVELKVTSVNCNAGNITMSLAFDSFSGEPLPWMTFTPEYFPAIFSQ